MDIVVKGRNVEVPEHYREHIAEKLTRLERYDRKTIRADVELFHERNPRQAKSCQRVEITLKSRGPAVRAEAASGDFYAALDSATSKLENRLRRMHDRRKVHYGRHKSTSVAEATSANTTQTVATGGSTAVGLLEAPAEEADADMSAAASGAPGDPGGTATDSDRDVPRPRGSADDNGYEPGRIVREKEHTATPMTVDQALYEMELVGHDFFLFHDKESDKPCVVYRRHAYDYGLIRLA